MIECLHELFFENSKANRLFWCFRRGNTALHECCYLGQNGIEPLEILLK